MHRNTEILRGLRAEHNLTGHHIAEMLSVENNTAMRWLMPETDRVIPDNMLKLLIRQIKKHKIVEPKPSNPHKNTIRLRELKEAHKLTAPMIGQILGSSKQTVTTWLMLDTPRVIPFQKLYDLEVHLNGEFRKLD